MFALLDGRPLQGPTGSRGVGAYVRALARGLAEAEPDRRFGLLVDPREPPPAGAPQGERWTTCRAAAPPGPALAWGRLLGPRWLRASGAAVFHATFLAPPRVPRGMPWVATIHDLIPLRHPRLFSWRTRQVFGRSLAACARADLVVAISEHTARGVRDRYGVPARRLRVIPPPLEPELFALRAHDERGTDDSPYLLHLGGFDPLKGVTTRLLPAFASVARRAPELRLVLTGPPGPGRAAAARAARELGLTRQVRFPGVLPGPERCALLARAAAVVVASDEEGFGLPAAEALALGLPVAVGPAEATRELVGEAAFLAADGSPGALAEAIRAALAAPGPATPAGRDRRERARRFEARAVAARFAALYREITGEAAG